MSSQTLKELNIDPKDDVVTIQRGCDDPEDAQISIYSKIEGLAFKLSNGIINSTKYFKTENEYVLCVDPGTRQILTVSHTDYIPKDVSVRALDSKEVVYFLVNPKEVESGSGQSGENRKGEFYINSNPTGAKISMDGNPDWEKETPFTFKGYEAKKYSLTLTKNNFMPSKVEININAEKPGSKNIELTPITGFLSIESGNSSANGAKITILEKEIGHIPISNFKYTQGTFNVIIEKTGFSTVKKQITINEGKETKLSINLFPAKPINITSNPDKAKITIDGKYVGKSSLLFDIPIGEHTFIIAKDKHKSQTQKITIDENTPSGKVYNFILDEDQYSVQISSIPSGASISIDGKLKNSVTNTTINAPYGFHSFRLKKKSYFPRTVLYNITSSKNEISKRLFPEYLANLSFLYGLDSWGLELGGTIKHFSIAVSVFPNIKNNLYNDPISAEHQNDVFEFDPNFMTQTNQKNSLQDSAGLGYSIKIGFVILQPFMIRFHGGYGTRGKYYYWPLYKANMDFSNTVHGNVNKDEMVKGELESKTFESFMFGIEVPVFNYLNILTDYWLDSERGPGLVFGIGLNLFGNQ